MAKKGLTTEKVIERERQAFKMFQDDPEVTARAVRDALKKKSKFGMRLGRLYELKRFAKEGKDYQPKARGAVTQIVTQAARKGGERLPVGPANPQHPAVAQAYKIMEDAGLKHIQIDAMMPVHFERAAS